MTETIGGGPTMPTFFPDRAGVVCCGAALPPVHEGGPVRTYLCPVCNTRYALIVKPERRVQS